MELIVLVGLQGAGKSTFCSERLHGTHLRLCRDVLGTENRMLVLFHAALAVSAPIVLDNTNPTARARARFLAAARAAGYRTQCYYFDVAADEAIARNAVREGKARVPDVAILGTAAKMELPSPTEGFDAEMPKFGTVVNRVSVLFEGVNPQVDEP